MSNAILAQANNGSGSGLVVLGLILVLLGFLYFCAWIYALYSAATSSSLNGGERVVWIVLLIFLPGIGTLLYFLLAGRGK